MNGPPLLTIKYRPIIGEATIEVLRRLGDMPPLLVATTRLPPWLATETNLLLETLFKLLARS